MRNKVIDALKNRDRDFKRVDLIIYELDQYFRDVADAFIAGLILGGVTVLPIAVLYWCWRDLCP
jgi:hypothetical protein